MRNRIESVNFDHVDVAVHLKDRLIGQVIYDILDSREQDADAETDR